MAVEWRGMYEYDDWYLIDNAPLLQEGLSHAPHYNYKYCIWNLDGIDGLLARLGSKALHDALETSQDRRDWGQQVSELECPLSSASSSLLLRCRRLDHATLLTPLDRHGLCSSLVRFEHG